MMEIFLVGGAVRDQLLNYPYTEQDWVITGATPEALIAQGFTPVGKDFPVFLHPETHEEYALARTERKTAPGYKGFTFHTDPDVTLEEDLKRRDLTINAIARSPSGELIDPYDGQQDIKNKRLQHVSPAFSEDPVRILRVARFAARYHHLGFTVADSTLQLMQSMVANDEAKHLVVERVWQECEKALREKNPEQFFLVLQKSNALEDVVSLSESEHLSQAISILEQCSLQTQDQVTRFSAFCFSFSTGQQQSILKALNPPNEIKTLVTLVEKHYTTITKITLWNKQNLSLLFQSCDALRKPERFLEVVQTCQIIHNILSEENPSLLQETLANALECYQQVDPQALIKQGYEKAELGKAIQAQRVKNLQDWLEKNDS